MRLIATLFLLLACAGPSLACPPVFHRPAVVVKEVVTPAIIAEFVPVIVAIPQYSVGPATYVPPTAPPAAGPALSPPAEAALKARIAELEAKLAGQAQPAAAAPTSAAVAIMQSRCASCHESQSAQAKGGGFVLFQGALLAPLDLRAGGKIAGKVYSGKMPPKNSGIAPLTDEDVGAIMALVETLK
jgi:hypothetical protein